MTGKKSSLTVPTTVSRKKILITGSSGLVGSAAVMYFCDKGYDVVGIDNNMRLQFFGKEGDTSSNKRQLIKNYDHYEHHNFDIRDTVKLKKLFEKNKFYAVIHTAAQPSHDWSAKEPLTDFSINAVATLNILELIRTKNRKAIFIFTSTNKVYGDHPNSLPLKEEKTRYELPKNHKLYSGIDESMSLDQSIHSVFGVSKTAADLLVQEYGKNFGIHTGIFRCGCLTGSGHAGTKLHGFLAYLVKSLKENKKYTIIGYKGKQVRDNLHVNDLVRAFDEFIQNPKKGAVYNMGGGRDLSVSILEAIELTKKLLHLSSVKYTYTPEPRVGDHIWYVTNFHKFQKDFPQWKPAMSIEDIIVDIATHSQG